MSDNDTLREMLDEARAKIARAEKLAEAVHAYVILDRPFARESVVEALAAFRSPEPQPEGDSEPHPDTVRLDWLHQEAANVSTIWDDDRLHEYEVEGGGVIVRRARLREAIDAAREGESDA